MIDSGERRLAAIMFTDIVGYTAVMGRDESAGRRVRGRHRAEVGALVAQYGGEIIDENGDELVICFESAVDAVNCSLRTREQLADDPELVLRTGIHLGDVVFEGGRLYGDSVNLAARVRAEALPGDICVSSEVWQAVRNQPNVETRSLGTRELKNVDRPVELYAVTGTAAEPRPDRRRATQAISRLRARRTAAAALAIALLAALAWWVTRPAGEATPIRSIAVLPFENLSDDPEQEFFVDGMTESLIADLSRVSALRITSRTSVMQYKGSRRPLREVAEALGVDALIEGSVVREGDRVRVTAQLIDARTDSHLWSEQYDRDLRGILSLQSEIASAIARRVDARLSPALERRFQARPPANPAAHDEYLKGVYFAQKHTPTASLRARDHFNAGMRFDPNYPLPYAGLADTLSCSPLHTWAIPAAGAAAVPMAVMDQAHALATRAVALDHDLPEAQTALGLVDIFRHHDWEKAEQRFRQAIELNPSYEFALRAYAMMLVQQRRFPEAIEKIERARALDPLGPFVASLAGDIYRYSGDPEKAIALWREAGELDSAHPLGFQGLGVVLCQRGQLDDAIALFGQARRLSHDDPLVVGDLAYCYATSGRADEARALLRELEARSANAWVSPISLALTQLGLGNRDAALDQLERAYEIRAYRLIEIGVDDRWDPLRGDPRFEAVMRQVGLPSR